MDLILVRTDIDRHTCVMCGSQLHLQGVVNIAPSRHPPGQSPDDGSADAPDLLLLRVRCLGCGYVNPLIFPREAGQPLVPDPLIHWLNSCAALDGAYGKDQRPVETFAGLAKFWARVRDIVARSEQKQQNSKEIRHESH